jgi:hypothetical protein
VATQDLTPFMRRLVVTLTLTFALLAPAGALASGSAVIRDCTDDGRLEGHYSQRDLRDALSSIPSDVDEYTDCRDIIRRAAFGGAGSSGGGRKGGGGANSGGGAPGGEFGGFGGGGGASGATPDAPLSADQQKAVTAAAVKGSAPVRFSDGAVVRPGAVARRTAEVTDVPAPLVVVVLLLAGAALTAAIPSFRARVLARRDA